MRFLKVFKNPFDLAYGKQKPQKQIGDFYQASIEKVGRAQLTKLADKGLSIPVGSF